MMNSIMSQTNVDCGGFEVGSTCQLLDVVFICCVLSNAAICCFSAVISFNNHVSYLV